MMILKNLKLSSRCWMLDVVDEEAQNLLNHSNAAGDDCVLGALKTNGKLCEERAEDTDWDASPLPK